MNPKDQKENLLEFFKDYLPAQLTLVGLPGIPVENYISTPVPDPDGTYLSVLHADVDYNEITEQSTFVCQIQLPGVLSPDEYASALYDIVVPREAPFSPAIVGFMEYLFMMTTWYPGDDESGGSAFVKFGFEFSDTEDDCG